jgi:rare lipoprotein A
MVRIDSGVISVDAGVTSKLRLRELNRLCVVGLSAGLLAACAQSSVVSQRSALRSSLSPSSTRVASLGHHRIRVAALHPVSVVRREAATGPEAGDNASGRVSQGLASFYTEGTETASGEKFDTHQLTAAHPTLPFGTKLRVTNVSTGRSVTVRVNDRGPYVHGRVVDVSYSAAEALGMVGQGVAKVKLDVVKSDAE